LPILLRLFVVLGVIILSQLGYSGVDGRVGGGGEGRGHLLITIDGLNGTIPVSLKLVIIVERLKAFI
jgi:hypothetical protein